MEVVIHAKRELAKLLKKATENDSVAIFHTLDEIQGSGIESLSVKPIQQGNAKKLKLKELVINADNRYRIMITVSDKTVHCWSYCQKTSIKQQDKAIERAIHRIRHQ